MLSVNEVIDIQDKLEEVSLAGEKLDFIISRTLMEIEETTKFLREKGLKMELFCSNLSQVYSFSEIARDYSTKLLQASEEAKELLAAAREEAEE